MKIILILSVVVMFCEYLAITNAKFNEKHVEEYFRANRHIDDATRENLSSNMHARGFMIRRRSINNLKNKIIKSMHRDARRRKLDLKKMAKVSNAKIKFVGKIQENQFARYAKMGTPELEGLKAKLMQCKITTTSSAKDFMTLLNTTVEGLMGLLLTTSEDIKELTETNKDKMSKYRDECEAEIKSLENAKDKDKAKSTDNDQLLKLASTANEALSELFKSSDEHIKQVESTSRESVFNLTDNIKTRYEAISTVNEGINNYLVTMIGKFKDLGILLSDKYKEMVTNCVGLIEKLLENNKANLLKLATEYGKSLSDGGPGVNNENIQRIEDTFEKSNKKNFEDMLKALSSESSQVMDTMTGKVKGVQTTLLTG